MLYLNTHTLYMHVSLTVCLSRLLSLSVFSVAYLSPPPAPVPV